MKITEDYLVNLKLPRRVNITNPKPFNEYSIRDNFNIYCYMDTSGNCLFWGGSLVEYVHEAFLIVKCDTFFEFQNIYKMLTGKELVNETINEK